MFLHQKFFDLGFNYQNNKARSRYHGIMAITVLGIYGFNAIAVLGLVTLLGEIFRRIGFKVLRAETVLN